MSPPACGMWFDMSKVWLAGTSITVAAIANSSALGGFSPTHFSRMSTFVGPSMGEMATIPSGGALGPCCVNLSKPN